MFSHVAGNVGRLWQSNATQKYCRLFIIFLPCACHRKSSEKKYFCTYHLVISLWLTVSRPNNLPEWDTAPMLQGVLHPGQQAKTDLWRCQAGLQVRWRWAAQHWNRKRAATDREVHTTAAAWRWRLLDWAPLHPTTPHGRDHKPRLPLAVLLAGWEQGQVQVFLSLCECIVCIISVHQSKCYEWSQGKQHSKRKCWWKISVVICDLDSMMQVLNWRNRHSFAISGEWEI